MLDKSKSPVVSLTTPVRISSAVACVLTTLAVNDARQSALASPVPKLKPDAQSLAPVSVSPVVAVAEVAAPERLTSPIEPIAAATRPVALEAEQQPRQWMRVNEATDLPVTLADEAAVSAIAASPDVATAAAPSVAGTGQDGLAALPTADQVQERVTRRPLPRIMRDYDLPSQKASQSTVSEPDAVEGAPSVEPAPATPEPSGVEFVSQMPEAPLSVAQAAPSPSPSPSARLDNSQPPVPSLAADDVPSESDILQLQEDLDGVEAAQAERESVDFGNQIVGSPAVTISNPSGYGADNFEGFVGFSYQSRLRYLEEGDASMGVGIGLGDAQRAVGLQLSYTLASFGSKDRDFGTGGFNAKLHRQFPGGWSVALGWEGFAEVGSYIEFEDVVYGSVTHIIKTAPDVSDPFSRIAVTAGVGNGRFRTEEQLEDDEDAIGVFGSVAVRVAQPVSAIVEWTGNDLAVGLSIVPFRNFPLVITPAVRDIAGAGDGARFVLGTGFTFQF